MKEEQNCDSRVCLNYYGTSVFGVIQASKEDYFSIVKTYDNGVLSSKKGRQGRGEYACMCMCACGL